MSIDSYARLVSQPYVKWIVDEDNNPKNPASRIFIREEGAYSFSDE